jgi:DNA-binding PadR family transcriptional regulator
VRVRDAVLALLTRGPAHGYQLKVDYERLTRNKPVNVGQIYQTLERLQRDGLVEREACEESERRIAYHATTTGRASAYDFLLDASAPHHGDRSEVAAKVLLAVEIPDFDAIAVIDAQRAALIRSVQAARRQTRGQEISVIERLGIEAELAVTEAELRWLDLCEDELKGVA